MKHRFWIVCFPLAASLAGCLARQEKNGTGRRDSAAVTTAVGADRDAHGCIGSAGYVWSQVREECIRPFEAGIRMAPAAEPDATTAAYIVFAEDSSRAELFLPDGQKTEILDRRTLPGGGSAWNVEDDDTKNVRLANGRWIIEQRGKTLYEQYEAPITTLFEGTDGKSRRRFRVEVRFSAGRAEVTLDGTVFDLPQYPTGSGYGYGNDIADFRGKGTHATLKMRDGLTLSLEQAETR
ncbi:MliC family protein [Alistipes ihumii]|jgi:hypothetical protein|uniref:MliC family protein n=1 Tax=Alistipes ihumii TaxID=1470347 RepID=UPI001D8A70D8|nr:MliC family protein [Alistipes ihumii]HJG74755.1 hypothetical protein [Alistipes ihumii]